MKFYTYLIILSVLMLTGCSWMKKISKSHTVKHELINPNTFHIKGVAQDATYAFSQHNPVKVGGADTNNEILNERRFLNALRGPNGERLTYELTGSCCYYKTPEGSASPIGMLDRYEVTYGNRKHIIYLTPFEKGELKAPKGFSFVKK